MRRALNRVQEAESGHWANFREYLLLGDEPPFRVGICPSRARSGHLGLSRVRVHIISYSSACSTGAVGQHATSEAQTARWRRPFAFLFRGDRQVAFVAIELEGLKLTCRHGTVGLATCSDHSDVRGARRCSIRCEPHIHRLAVAAFTVETMLVDREDFGAATILSPSW